MSIECFTGLLVRILRYLLQTVILLLGSATLAALAFSRQFEPLAFIVLLGFFGFLFLLTLLLREATETRLVVGRQTSMKITAAFLFVVGLGICSLSVSILNGYSGSQSRRGALLRTAIELLGPWPPALFFLVVGLFVLGLALRSFRTR